MNTVFFKNTVFYLKGSRPHRLHRKWSKRVELGVTEKKLNPARSRVEGSNPGPPDYKPSARPLSHTASSAFN